MNTVINFRFKENGGLSYPYYTQLFNISDSDLKRIVSNKIQLSYEMYLKFKELGFFEDLKKKKPINYNNIPVKFKAWKEKVCYINPQCTKISNVSVATVKRLGSGKIKPFAIL